MDLGHRHPPAHRRLPPRTRAPPPARRRQRARAIGRGAGAARSRARGPGRRPQQPLARAPGGGAGDGARRPDHARGGTSARDPAGHGQDTDDAGQAPTPGGTRMTWHADAALLARYTAGSIDDASASSVEAHLVACADCRQAVSTTVDTTRLDAIWAEVTDTVDVPRPRPVERFLRTIGVPDPVAR